MVDEIVPLKGLAEDAEDTQMKIKMIESVRDEDIDELPSNLVRRKSELTLLFEGARKTGEVGGSGRGRERNPKRVHVITEGEIRR